MDPTTRVNLVQSLLKTKELPASTGAALLDVNRTSIYYKGTPVSQEELECKEIIDHLHTDYSGSVVKTDFYAIYNESDECMFCSVHEHTILFIA